MTSFTVIQAGAALFVAIVLINSFQADTKIYQDFKEFDPSEILEYGIFDVQTKLQIDLLKRLEHISDLPKANSFYIHEMYNVYRGDQLAELCQNHSDYLMNKRIFLELREYEIESFVKCLKSSMHQNFTGLIILAYSCSNGSLAPLVSEMQNLGVQFGFFALTNERALEGLQKCERMGIHNQFVMVRFEITENMFYDYNSFAKFFDDEYAIFDNSKTGFNTKVIVNMKCKKREFPWLSNNYGLLMAKFLYRWAENNKRLVVFEHDVCAHEKNNWLLCSKNQTFNGHMSGRYSWQVLVSEVQAVPRSLKTILGCTTLNSFLIEIDHDLDGNFEYLLKLAQVHSILPCNVTWSFTLPFYTFHNTVLSTKYNPAINKTMRQLSIIKNKHPNLIDELFVCISDPPAGMTKQNQYHFLQEYKIFLQTTYDFLNFTPKIIQYEKHYEVKSKNSVYEQTTFKLYYTNSSAGTILKLFVQDPIDLEKLNAITYYSVDSERFVIVFLYWSTIRKKIFGGCYEYKKDLIVAKNWADTHSFHFVVKSPLSSNVFQYKSRIFEKPWLKDEALFGNTYAPQNATKEELQFLSNIEDTCVQMDETVPANPVEFSHAYAGVTFTLSLDSYLNLNSKEVATLLKLIHYKFSAVEIVVKHWDAFITVKKAIAHIKADSDPAVFVKYKYFVNYDIRKSQAPIIPDQDKADHFAGLHSKLCLCEKDLTMLNELNKLSTTRVGVSLTYNQAIELANYNLQNRIIKHIDYSVIRVNIAEALLMGRYSEPTNHDLNKTFYYSLQYHTQYLPNPVFDNLRAYRLNFRRINPNVTVYIQLAWPTVNTNKSMERTQKLWAFVDEFSKVFDFPFFINEAFDESANNSITQFDLKYGWWKLVNDSDVSNPFAYVDKQSEFYNLETKRPFVNRSNAYKLKEATMPALEIAIGLVVLFLTLSCGGTVIIYKLRKRLTMMLTQEEIQQFEMGLTSNSSNQYDTDCFALAYDKEKYEMGKCAFDFDSSIQIGSGHFGIVYKSTIPTINTPVAVKVPKVSGKMELVSVLREIKVMSYVGEHENILKLLGAYTKEIQKGIVYVVTEFAKNGSLLDRLRTCEKFLRTEKPDLMEMYQFCLEISKGMHYLGTKKVIHGDLSTRNVLLDENKVCKICDFGLSRKLYDMDLYVKTSAEAVPWKWMAVETLERSELSLKSDIWSLGVTFWEIFSFGEEPYQSLSWDLEFSKKLAGGLRLPRPEMADPSVYQKLLSCWEIDPNERPEPDAFVCFFRNLKNNAYINL